MNTTEKFNSISTQDINDQLVALMVLQEAERRNELDSYFTVLTDKMAVEAKDENAAFHLVNGVFSPTSIAEVKSAYAEIWQEIFDAIEAKNKASGNTLEVAGYSDTERENFSPALQQHFDIVREFEGRFPTAENENGGVVLRLWNSKEQLFDALSSPGGRKALEAASWGVSLATGAVVTKVAIRGAGYIAAQLIKNESVQDFAQKMQGRIGSFLERTGVPTGAISSGFASFKENAKAVMESPTFQRYGKPSLALAGLAMGALLLGEINHDKVVELASTGINKATDLASAGLDLGAQGVQYAADGLAAGGEAIANGVGSAISAVEQGASDVLASAKEAGSLSAGFVSNGIETAGEYVDKAGRMVAGVAVEGYETATAAVSGAIDGVTVAATDAINQGREAVADGLQGLAAQIAPESHTAYASAVGIDQVDTAAPATPEAVAPAAPAAPEVTTVSVAKGDSLWKIAEAQFEANGIDPSNAQIQAAAKELYEANKDVIGANPDRIFPGQELQIDPAVFGAEPVANVPAAAPVTPATPTAVLHDKVSNLQPNGGLQSASWKDVMASLASQAKPARNGDMGLGM